MGDLLPFKRKRKWTRASDYGQVLPARQWRGRRRGAPLRWRALRRWLPLVALAAICLWLGYREAAVPAPDPQSETIAPPFTICAERSATNCVVDGDTVKVGARTIRLLGFDAPELHPPRCVEEARMGLEAQTKLLTWLNQGPVRLTGPHPLERDDYGRELAHLVRVRPDGSIEPLADHMIASGTVRRYLGGARQPWC